MATDFGFRPVESGEYYFISYNTEDTGRVGGVARQLNSAGVPLWYDYGLEYGKEWQRQIARHIRGAKAVIMFVTRGMFFKERSYVHEEYEIAGAYKIPIYCVILDHIEAGELPDYSISWWLEIRRLHNVQQVSGESTENLSGRIRQAIGIGSTSQRRTVSTPASAVNTNDFVYNPVDDGYVITKYVGKGGAVVLPKEHGGEPVVKVGSGAFKGCNGLTSVTISDYVTNMGCNPFADCANLSKIEVSRGNKLYKSLSGALFSRDGAVFIACPAKVSGDYVIPYGVIRIDYNAFDGCTNLTSVTIPNSVTEIRSEAFWNCTGLTSITIPNSITEIRYSVFEGCTGLTSVAIPNTVRKIRSSAFKGCTGLTSVTIPDSVTGIDDTAFYGCTITVTAPHEASYYGYTPNKGVTWVVK